MSTAKNARGRHLAAVPAAEPGAAEVERTYEAVEFEVRHADPDPTMALFAIAGLLHAATDFEDIELDSYERPKLFHVLHAAHLLAANLAERI